MWEPSKCRIMAVNKFGVIKLGVFSAGRLFPEVSDCLFWVINNLIAACKIKRCYIYAQSGRSWKTKQSPLFCLKKTENNHLARNQKSQWSSLQVSVCDPFVQTQPGELIFFCPELATNFSLWKRLPWRLGRNIRPASFKFFKSFNTPPAHLRRWRPMRNIIRRNLYENRPRSIFSILAYLRFYNIDLSV